MNLKHLVVAVPTALCILCNWTANAGQTTNEAGAIPHLSLSLFFLLHDLMVPPSAVPAEYHRSRAFCRA